MPLKWIQTILEKIVFFIPNSEYKNKFKQFISKYNIWTTTLNIKVANNYNKINDFKVFEIEHFLSDIECDLIIKLAKKKGLVDSTIINDSGDKVIDTYTRKSQQCWLTDNENDIIQAISKRVSDITNIPIEHQEDLQIVSYEPECYYKPHFDASYHPRVIPVMNLGSGPRIYTFIIYLNECEGGETEFPKLGVKIKPQKGKAILFQNIDENLDLIPESMHGGCPVISGRKWIANKWIRVWPFKMMDVLKEFENKSEKPNNNNYIISPNCFKNINTVVTYNLLYRNFPFAFYNLDDFIFFEIDNFLDDKTCDSILKDKLILNTLDTFITTQLNAFITVPTENPMNHFSKLMINEYQHKIITPMKGLNYLSLYLFVNEDYLGGSFHFPNASKTIFPKKGKAILFSSVDKSLNYDPRSLCIIENKTCGKQFILEKHIHVLPNDLKFVLQESDQYVNRVYEIFKEKQL